MDDTAGNTVGNTAGRRRLDLKEAATALSVTSEAIRRRAKRGTLPSEKGEDGRLYVWVPDVSDGVHGVSGTGPHGVSDGGSHADDGHDRTPASLPEALLERFEDENDFLRRELERLHRELERKDAILLTMAQRIPELEPAREASPEATGGSVSHSEGTGASLTPDDDQDQQKPSWWRRFFGFE
jgi:hypothetical protein